MKDKAKEIEKIVKRYPTKDVKFYEGQHISSHYNKGLHDEINNLLKQGRKQSLKDFKDACIEEIKEKSKKSYFADVLFLREDQAIKILNSQYKKLNK